MSTSNGSPLFKLTINVRSQVSPHWLPRQCHFVCAAGDANQAFDICMEAFSDAFEKWMRSAESMPAHGRQDFPRLEITFVLVPRKEVSNHEQIQG